VSVLGIDELLEELDIETERVLDELMRESRAWLDAFLERLLQDAHREAKL